MPASKKRTIEIENVVSPGRTTKVDADKYEAMRTAMLAVLPAASPGLNGDESAIALYGKLGRREDVIHFDILTGESETP